MEENKASKTQTNTRKKANSEIKPHIVVAVSIATAILVLSIVYFKILLPILNPMLGFLHNPAPDGKSSSDVVLGEDDLFDPNDPYYSKKPEITPEPTPSSSSDPSATPSETVDPSSTAQPTETATPEPGEFRIEQATFVHASEMVFEEGTKNILLLGFDEKKINCDTIFILNINEAKKEMKLISVPRDTYVPHSIATKDELKRRKIYDSPGIHKLNAVIYIGTYVIKYPPAKFNHSGIDYMCAILSKLLPGCEIDDYFYVYFDGFMDIVDVIGGVYVTSPENMYTDTGELAIKEGLNKLNAREALFYVRYRKRLDSQGHDTYTGSDNWRKLNQANFIAEIMTQVITKENMTYNKIVDTLNVLQKSLYHSLNASSLSYYIGIGNDFADKKYTVYSYVIKGYTIDPFGDKAGYSQLD